MLLNPEVRWEQKLQPTPDGWDVWHSQLYVGSGLVSRTDASRHGMTLLELCDGRRTVGEVLTELTAATGQELPVPRVLGTIRQLVEQGFLLPAG